ncbi:hypothetical protein GGR28_001091 [Lewinella aquimaris]|uniref:Uncharacterized protein n=1 Tax=Neolewinella aquimaris TaxID=1835722 RepID=A0A840E8U4_9BACT|nr:hypothetical protein [Neolewinella aquimaris]MBB4078478.1 hypothetical protein [Neolewinella aquimaris]
MKALIIGLLMFWLWPVAGQRTYDIHELQALSPATFRLAFHFVGLEDGRNFTGDPDDPVLAAHGNNEKLRADVLMRYLLNEMNFRFRTALLDFAPSRDARIRFALVNGAEEPLRSAFFYRHGERVRTLDDAMNIIFTRYPGPGKAPDASVPGVGSNRIHVYNRLPGFLKGSHDTWTIARIINHELGHTQGLDHTFNCNNPCAGIDLEPEDECFGACTTNNNGSAAGTNCYGGSGRDLMMGYGSQLHLTVCETEQLWNYMLRHPRPWVELPFVGAPAPW